MNTPLIDEIEAARLLGLTTRQVMRLVRRDELPHVELPNGEVRFTEGDLSAWVESRKRPAREATR